MCVAFMSLAPRFVLASNRDEFLARPTAPARWWDDEPTILGGRDLKEGGTWLALSRDGRFGFVTNFRDPGAHREGRLSRGELVPRFLQGSQSPEAYLKALATRAGEYNPFNLVVGDLASAEPSAWFLSSRAPSPVRLPRGAHAVSNGDLGAPWPKVVEGRRRFAEILEAAPRPDLLPENGIFRLMEDRSLAPDAALPSTGVPLEVERALSAIFIRRPGYGTRSTTLIERGPEGRVSFVERTYLESGEIAGEARFSFKI